MPTYTTNYSFEQPVVGGDVNLWGGKINTVIGQIDTQIKNRANDITTVSTSVTTLSNATVKLDGSVTMTGMLKLPSSTNPTLSNHAVPKSYADSLVTGFAALASPAFTGTPTAPTAAGGTNTTQIATTAFVTGALGSYLTTASASSTYAPKASPAFTGTPTIGGVAIATTDYVLSNAPSSWKIGARRTADLSRASTATYANDGVLVFTPPANKDCLIRVFIYATGGAGGIKVQLSGASAANPVAQTTLTTVNGLINVIGFVASSASPSAVNVQWAQNSSSLTASVVKASSFIEYIEL